MWCVEFYDGNHSGIEFKETEGEREEMGNLTKLGGVIAAISMTAYLQGCSSGDSFVKELDPGSSGATINGSAAKGLLANADCVASTVSGTVLYSSVGMPTPCTGVDGRYSFQLFSNPTTPVVVNIVARAGETTMKCDDPDGCPGGVAFGGDVTDLGDDFSMRAIVPSVSELVSESNTPVDISVTPWTEVAAERAITLATQAGGSGAQVTAEQTREAYRSVASVLNNVLSLENDPDNAFNENFFSIPVPDLTAPSTGAVSNAADRKRAALLSIATGALLKQTNDTVKPSTLISNLATSFKDDGVFDVNDTADNRAGDAINLEAVVRNIASTAGSLSTALSTNTEGTQALNELLGGTGSTLTTTLSTIEESATELADKKDAVENQEEDDTAPVEVTPATESDFDKAKRTAANFVTLVAAAGNGFDFDDEANTVLRDVFYVLESTNSNYDIALQMMAELMGGAADMILSSVVDNDVTRFTNSGCTLESSGDLTCSTLSLFATLGDPGAELRAAAPGTGSIKYTASDRTVRATNVDVNGVKLTLELEGDTSTTAPTYTVKAATVMLPDDVDQPTDLPDITFGSTTTVSATSTNGEATTFTVDANGVLIDVQDFKFEGALDVTRDLTVAGLLTNFRLDGGVSIGANSDLSVISSDANKGKGVRMVLAFKGNKSGLPDGATALVSPEQETADNFLATTDMIFELRAPAAVARRIVDDNGNFQTQASTAVDIVVTLEGFRNAVKNGDVTNFRLRTVGAFNISLVGDVTFTQDESGQQETITYTLGDANTSISLAVVDTQGVRTVSGSANTKGTSSVKVGDVQANGDLVLTDPANTANSAAISLPGLILNNQNQ